MRFIGTVVGIHLCICVVFVDFTYVHFAFKMWNRCSMYAYTSYTHTYTLVIRLGILFGRLTAFRWFIFVFFLLSLAVLIPTVSAWKFGKKQPANQPTKKKMKIKWKNDTKTIEWTAVYQNTSKERRIIIKIKRPKYGPQRKKPYPFK